MDPSTPNNLLGDEARLRQILINLLSNAVKYTPKGFIRLEVRSQKIEEKTILIIFEVSDSGIGIQEQDIPKLFRRFTRLDMKKNHGVEGTGLGLTITRSLCKAMGGTISISSKYNEGSCFTASIPQAFSGGPPLAVVENPSEKRTLCYEEEPLYVESLAWTLTKLGVPVKVCAGQGRKEEFFRELEEGKWPFVFVNAEIMEKTTEIIKTKSIPTTAVFLAKPGETAPVRSALAMPIYVVPVAQILNHQSEEPRKYRAGHFSAPEARVLVVDDIHTNLVVTAGLLAAYRCQVDTCLSGKEAIDMVQKKSYDMVFMDHMMPGMDGIETTEVIRDWERGEAQKAQKEGQCPSKQIPIIALTANAITGMKEMFLAKGFNAYLAKPIEIPKLEEIMDVWTPPEKKRWQTEADEEKKEAEQNAGVDGLFVEGLDTGAGKKRYGEEAYREILRSYFTHTPALLEKLRALMETPLTKESLGEYVIIVHGLKGSSYGICAAGLGKRAEALEEAARAGDIKTLETAKGPFVKALETLLVSIGGLLEANETAAKPRLAAPDRTLLSELLEACKHFRTKIMERTLAKLETYEYDQGRELIALLREHADNLEYEAIIKELEKK